MDTSSISLHPHAQSTDDQCMEAIREEEARLGRPMSHRERAAFASGFSSETARLAAWKIVRA